VVVAAIGRSIKNETLLLLVKTLTRKKIVSAFVTLPNEAKGYPLKVKKTYRLNICINTQPLRIMGGMIYEQQRAFVKN